MLKVIAALSCCVMMIVAATAASTTTVTTPYGDVVGIADAITPIVAFKGIPYAKPPLGKLRFMPPEEPEAWTTPLNASKFSDGCMALCPKTSFPKPELMCTPKVSEDCLYLNVYSPNVSSAANLPVIFFMHGGNFIGGSGGVPLYDGSDLAKHQNVVVVTINYRLGLFGGLYTGTIRGNMMLKDQRLALKWVKKSIKNFGGNPDLVTLTGQSAGVFSVATHLASPPSWGLFQRAVIESDPFALLAMTPELGMVLSDHVLDVAGCPKTGGQTEIDCLQNSDKLTSEFLLNVSAHTNFKPKPNDFLDLMMRWVPVVDGEELPQQPLNALRDGQFDKTVPVMFGTVANESVQFIYDIFPKPISALEYYLFIDAIFNTTAGTMINKLYGPVPEKYKDDAREFMTIMATDYMFYCPNRAVGRGLAKHTPTFMYMFDYVASFFPWVDGKDLKICANEVCHADDLAFVFYSFGSSPNLPNIPKPWANETKLARTVQSAWGNFARTGVPNPLAHTSAAFPTQFNATSNVLVNYSIPTSMLVGYRDSYCDFWDKLGYNRR